MRGLRGIARLLSWSFERGSLRYDLAVAAILLFVFLTPRSWFQDQVQTSSPPHSAEVALLAADPDGVRRTYRIDAHLLARPRVTPELEREIHNVLARQVRELQGRRFQIESVEAVRGEGGVVLYYDVSVK